MNKMIRKLKLLYRIKTKSENFYKKLFSRKVVAAVGTVVVSVAALVIFSHYYICCFEFVVNGRTIGFSQSKDYYNIVREEINTQIRNDFGNVEAITQNAAIVPRIIKKTDMTSYNDFFDNVACMSNCMSQAQTLIVNGEPTISFPTKRDLDDALEMVKNEYSGGGEVTIEEAIGAKEGYVSAMKLYNTEQGAEYIMSNKLITGTSVVFSEYTESIPYEERTVEDNSLYVGDKKIIQDGIDGEKNIGAEIVLKNGEEVSRNILTEVVVRQPQECVYAVGTKQVPDGKGTGSFIFPTDGNVSSRFGGRWGRSHEGIDISNSYGTEIYAADEGKVIFSGVQNGYGNIIIIDHGNGYTTRYAHCSQLLKNVGDIVAKGDLIAKSGSTGRSTGNHLHFEIRKDGEPVNPLDFVG